MSSVLVIFGGDRPDVPFAYRRLDAQGAVTGAGDAGASDLADLAARDAILVLPGYVIRAVETQLAARSERQALAAAPFAVEDDLASDPDMMHFALMPARRNGPEGQRTVLAIDRALLEDWMETLSDAGLTLRAVLPDYLCLEDQPGRITAAGLLDRLVLRAGDWGVALESDIATAVAPALIESRPSEAPPILIAGTDHGVDGLEPPAANPDATLTANAADPLDRLAIGARQAGPGVLQGAFAVRHASGERGLSLDALRWPAMLAAAATLAFSAVNLVEGLMLQAQAETVQAETHALFLETFPEAGRVVNVRAQMRQMRQGGETGRPDFLILSGYVAAGLDAVDAVSVESLRYDSDANEISTSVLFDSYDALARFRAAVEAAGGRVVEGGSRQVGDRRSGDLKVTLP
ncbi:MAG: type II secretion system protein GspL [Pseudomonadota bacterium]